MTGRSFRVEIGSGQEAEDVADGVGMDLSEAGLGEAGEEPLGTGLFAEGRAGWRRGRSASRGWFWVVVQPGKGGVDGALGG